ncbi:MAG: hypothetical protein AAFP68_02635 [Pseudomonadota bacterium]
MKLNRKCILALLAGGASAASANSAIAHEAWLLTPAEVEALSRAPIPDLFTNPIVLGAAGLAAAAAAIAALHAEDRLQPLEEKLAAPISHFAAGLGLLAVRIGLALMLGLGALGGLPRSGTEPWTQAVLFVPDMQLTLVPGWEWLGTVALGLSLLLATGVLTNVAAAGVVILSALGIAAFGTTFLSYAPHFIAPALLLIVFGPGWFAADRYLGAFPQPAVSDRNRKIVWHLAMALVGGTFVYLGVAFKLLQPTLMIAILQHGEFPTFGLPIEIVALGMTGVEIVAGLLLAMGRLVRPVAIFLMGAFTFFAVMLGETPLFHANLYGVALILLMAGAMPPKPEPRRVVAATKLA